MQFRVVEADRPDRIICLIRISCREFAVKNLQIFEIIIFTFDQFVMLAIKQYFCDCNNLYERKDYCRMNRIELSLTLYLSLTFCYFRNKNLNISVDVFQQYCFILSVNYRKPTNTIRAMHGNPWDLCPHWGLWWWYSTYKPTKRTIHGNMWDLCPHWGL